MKTNRQIALSCLAMVVDGALRSALAQNPFGGPPAAPDAQVGGIVGWLLTIGFGTAGIAMWYHRFRLVGVAPDRSYDPLNSAIFAIFVLY